MEKLREFRKQVTSGEFIKNLSDKAASTSDAFNSNSLKASNNEVMESSFKADSGRSFKKSVGQIAVPFMFSYTVDDVSETCRRQCLNILHDSEHSTEEELLNQYKRYKTVYGDVLSEDDYICVQAFRRIPLFVFQYPKLAIRFISKGLHHVDSTEQPEVEARFIQFCEALVPLANKWNARRIYRCLIQPINLMRYIENLKELWEGKPEEGAITPDMEELLVGDRILFAKVTGMGRGSVVITDQHFIYREIITQHIVKFPYSKILAVEPCEFATVGASLLKNVPSVSYGLILKVKDQSLLSKLTSKSSEESNSFRISGKENVRDAILVYIRELVRAHKLVENTQSIIVRKLLVQNAWLDVIRSQALLKGEFITSPNEIQTLPEDSVKKSLEKISLEKEYVDLLEKSAGKTIFSLDTITTNMEVIDPDNLPQPVFEDGFWTYNISYLDGFKDVEDIVDLNQELDMQVLRKNLMVFHHNMRAIQVIRLIERRIRTWYNPSITALVYVINTALVLNDWLKFIPAMLFLANTILILLLLQYPESTQKLFNDMMNEVAKQKAKDEEDEEEQRSVNFKSIKRKIVEEKGGISSLYREGKRLFEQVKRSLYGKRDDLKELQNDVGRVNYRLLQLQALYTWQSPEHTKLFLIGCVIIFLMFYAIPFRFIWAIISVRYFTMGLPNRDVSNNGIGDRFIRTLPAANPPSDVIKGEDSKDDLSEEED